MRPCPVRPASRARSPACRTARAARRASRSRPAVRSNGSASWIAVGIAQVGQGDPDQRQPAPGDHRPRRGQQPAGDPQQRRGPGRRLGDGVRPGRPRVVVEAQAQHHRPARAPRRAHPPRDAIDRASSARRRSRPASAAAGPARAGRRSTAAAAAPSPAAGRGCARARSSWRPAARPEHRDQRLLTEPRDLSHGRQPLRVELGRRDRADAPQPLDRQRVQEGQLPARRDDQQAVGLGHPARHLRQELRAGQADRDRPARPPHAPSAQPRGDLRRRARDVLAARARRGTPRRSTAPRPAATSARTPRTPPCSPRCTPRTAAARRPRAGTTPGPARLPSPCAHRTPWPRSWPRAPLRRRRSPAAPAGVGSSRCSTDA